MTKKAKIITLLITYISIVLLLIIDQAVKLYIENNLSMTANIEIIKNFFYIQKVYNKGAAWGMGANNTLLLAVLSLVGSVIACYFAVKNDFKRKPFYSIALVLIIAGALGNMIDRFMTVFELRDGVIDMFALVFGSYNFPVFNIADMLLVVGVIVLAIDILFFEERRNKCKKDTE